MKKILSVDDEPEVLALIVSVLKRKGYEVSAVSDPEAAPERLDAEKIDLLVLDIKMPRKDGFALFLESKRKYRDMPVLFITGYPDVFNMEMAWICEMWTRDFADGNTDILYKPFDPSALIAKVEALIGPPDGNGV